MKKPYLLIITVILCLVLTGSMSLALAEDSYAETIEACKQVTRINPDATAHYNIGFVYGKAGMYKEAIERLKVAIRIDPDYVDAHFNLGVAYVCLNDRDSAVEQYNILKNIDFELTNKLFRLINK